MVRHFNPRSPMSLGTWGLLLFSCFSGSSACVQIIQDGLLGSDSARLARRLPNGALGAAGTAPAFFVGGYTGVLLGATAVPVWAKSAKLLGPLFLSSAFSSASSAITLALAATGAGDVALNRIEAIERTAAGAEAFLLLAALAKLGQTGQPLREGHLGNVIKFGVIGVGIIAPLALQLMNRKRSSRRLTTAGSILGLAGGFALRYAVVMAGHASADDPTATFDYAR